MLAKLHRFLSDIIGSMMTMKTNLSLEERGVSAEGSGQYVIIDFITKITTEDSKIICIKRVNRIQTHGSGQVDTVRQQDHNHSLTRTK